MHAEGPKKAEKNINYENKPGVQVHADPNFAIINHVRARAEHTSLGLKTRAENEARECRSHAYIHIAQVHNIIRVQHRRLQLRPIFARAHAGYYCYNTPDAITIRTRYI